MKRDIRIAVEGESFGLVADQPNGVFRQPAPTGVGCRHVWRPDVAIDESTGVELTRSGGETCAKCLATCRRNDAGAIVEYETEESRRLAFEIRSMRAAA